MCYFFSESYTYKHNASASVTGGTPVAGHPASDAIDYDKASYCETDGDTPSLIIDLGASRTIDSLWLKHSNISTFALYHSANGSDWTVCSGGDGIVDKGSGIFWYFAFTEQTKRYWKIAVTAKVGAGNVLFYEAMLMESKLLLEDEVDLPSKVKVDKLDTIGGSYIMADGGPVSYSGQKAYASITVMFEYTPQANKDAAEALFESPLRQALSILPDDEYPERIFRVIWNDTEFNLNSSIGYTGSGFSGDLEFQEY